jgi:riboflavin synthase
MFTGIIEESGIVKTIEKDKTNLVFTIETDIASQLKLNESVAHNGACLSVKPVSKKTYKVTAVQETLNKTNLKRLKVGDTVNLERSLKADGRIDGHFVLGHVDTVVKCIEVKNLKGSHEFTFSLDQQNRKYLVKKGSITINGISLTVASLGRNSFSVAIIPYTFEHTNFKMLKKGNEVNIEFDLLGKYVLNAKK